MGNVVLVVAAHSDDESIGCAGTLAKHIDSGDEVHVLFMTNGVGARTEGSEQIELRSSAAKQAVEVLNLNSIQNLDFPDNALDTVPLIDVTRAIEKKIAGLQPNIIYTHHIGDLNVDHQVTHKAVMTASRPQPGGCIKEIYAFEVLSSTEWQTPGIMPFLPNVFIDITDYIEIKRKALQTYKEEMRQPPHTRSIENIIRLNAIRGNSIGFEFAESFMLIRHLK